MIRYLIVCPNCQKTVLEDPTPQTICAGCGKPMPKLKRPKSVQIQN